MNFPRSGSLIRLTRREFSAARIISQKQNDVLVLSAVRTPNESSRGSLAKESSKPGAHAIRRTVAKSGVDVSEMQEVYWAGLPKSTIATTLNNVCTSGMQRIILAAQNIRLRDHICIAGGMESMSNVPYYMKRGESPYRGVTLHVNNPTVFLTFKRDISRVTVQKSKAEVEEDEEHERNNRKQLTVPQKIVESFSLSWQPYLKLSRMHRPIGTWLLFWPCTWGLALGSEGLPSIAILSLFGVGAFIMRGAGCTINDMWDRHIDAKVKRTVDRPLACGQLRMRHAAVWLASQLSLAFFILCQLNAPCFIIGVGSLGLVIFYPLAKRVTHWPQAVLGLTFNTGVIMGYTSTQTHHLGYLDIPWIDNPACMALYLSGLSWTLIYDTIYAHQDKEDDALLGLGSTARKFGDNTKYWLSGFAVSMVSSLTAAGIFSDLTWPYYIGVAATASHLVWQIKTLDINSHQSCADRFTSNRHIGWLIFLSLVGSYYVKKSDSSREDREKKSSNDSQVI